MLYFCDQISQINNSTIPLLVKAPQQPHEM